MHHVHFFSDSLSVSDVFNFVFPITLEEVKFGDSKLDLDVVAFGI